MRSLRADARSGRPPRLRLLANRSAPGPLEEVVVTGERQESARSQIIQAGTFRGADQLDTPMTVSVLTDEIIRSQQDQSLGEVLRNTAGVTGFLVSPSVLSNVSMRGIPVDARTNFKLNGALSVVNFIEQPLEDKARGSRR